ncbi:MAG TPA: NB-ARC domain-containing protein [Longimicrobium sp.]|nr:NB-ARC domain-containing protein [Longimicrobium sp.]
MADSMEPGGKGGMPPELRDVFTPIKLAFELSAAFIFASLGWLVKWLSNPQSASLRQYLWPEGTVLFLALLAALLILDNRRLRRRRKAATTAAAAPPAPAPPITRHPNALDESAVEGRENEIEEVVKFVMCCEQSFLCLHGPGGVGKTTVARAALGRLAHLRTAFVSMEAVEVRSLAPQAVDQALAVAVATQGLGMPLVGRDSPVESVTNALRLLDARTVLIIDNVEQVAGRAAPLISRWAQVNPLVRVIVTSRVELNVGTERVLEVDVFPSHPAHRDPATILRDPGPALRLFARRRKARHSSFRLSEENVLAANRICEAVGGLPLGLELAAAVERTLEEIERGINESSAFLASSRPDLHPRHRSLAATIDWSLALLDRHCRALALQLSVAAGPLDDEAVAGIASIPAGDRPTQALLTALVDAALVVRSENEGRSHYREPVEVRRRCAELRRDCADAQTCGTWTRFAATFAARAGAAYAERYGPGIRQGLDAVERDYPNLVAVAQRAEQPTDPLLAGRAGVYLAWFTSMRRPSEPRIDTLTALLAEVPATEPALVAELRTALAVACHERWARTGEHLRDAALSWGERAVEAATRAGDPLALGEAWRTLGLSSLRASQSDLATSAEAASHAGRAASAFAAAAEAFVQARQFAAAAFVHARWSFLPGVDGQKQLAEARRLLAGTNSPLARLEVLLAEVDQWQQSQTAPAADVRSLTHELREIAAMIDSDPLRLRALHAAAVVESELDDQDRALGVLDEKARLARTAGATVELGITLSDMAAVMLRCEPLSVEALDRAIGLLDDALPLIDGRGLPQHVAILHCNRAWALLGRGNPREALADSTAAMENLGELAKWDPPNAFNAVCVHARVLHATGDAAGSSEWASRARQLGEEHGFNEGSAGPEIRQHARWLQENRGEAAPAPLHP